MESMLPFAVVCILVLSGLGAGALSLDSFKMSLENEEYDMVIIGPSKFSSSIEKLVEHKNDHNVLTFFKSTESIYNEFEGFDSAEEIKLFIKNAIETFNIDYVLLFGGLKGQLGNWYVPVRYVNLDDGLSNYDTYFTDLYYADIYDEQEDFDDWDSNDNGIFGEWKGFEKDELNLEPDVCVGRLPCRNIFEAIIIVNKIIDYENNLNTESWFNQAVMVGGDTFIDNEGCEGEEVCDFVSGYLNGYEIVKLYTSLGTISSSDDFIDAINSGCGFIFTRAKGGQDRIRVYTSDGTEIIALDNGDINQLKNKDMYPVAILGECIHAKFDVSLLNYFKYFRGEPNIFQQDCVFRCIAWKLVSKYNGGAIAALTNTNLCFGTPGGDSNQNGVPDDAENFGGRLAAEVLRLYGEEEMNVLGDIFYQTIEDYVKDFPVNSNKFQCKSIQDWILIGDPSLRIGGYY